MLPSLLLPLFLTACTGGDASNDTADTAPVDTDDSDTSPPDPTPVWTQWPAGSSSTFNGVYASGEGVYAVGSEGKAYVGGADQTWVDISPDLPDESLSDVWGQGAGDSIQMVVSATSGNIATYTASGWTVQDLGTSNHEGIGGSSAEALYAVSWGGIYASDGSTWTFENPPSNERLNDVYGVAGDAIAVGEAGAILRRGDGGTWAALESGVTNDLNGVAGTSMSDVWAVGADGVALHFDGSTWTATETGVTEALWAVFAPATTSVYAVGNNGTAIYWDGSAWTSLPTGVANNLYAVHGASAVNVWAVGNRGMTLQYKAN